MSTSFLKFGKLMEQTWISIPMTTFDSGLLYVNNGMAKEIKPLKMINEERLQKEAGMSNLEGARKQVLRKGESDTRKGVQR